MKILILTILFSFSVKAMETMTVYKTPTCGCCTKWVEHMRANGFKIVEVLKTHQQMQMIKDKHGVPKYKRSCHTGVMGKFVFEGHVPASSVKKFLKKHKAKKNYTGLTVPDMPVGSPGMEMGDRKDPYTVLRIDEKGNTSAFEKF